MRLSLIAELCCALCVPAVAQAIVRQPTEAWVVDFDAAQCVASRNYGSKDKPLFLALKAPPLGNVMQVNVVRPGTGSKYAYEVDATLRLDGGDRTSESMIIFASTKTKQMVYRINMRRERLSKFSQARTVSIKAGAEFEESFELSQMAPLLRVMDRCVADLRQVWNVAEDNVPGPSSKPRRVGPLAVISGDDYPAQALDRTEQGTAGLAILVDEAGKVADCTVIETSGVAALDSQSCGLMKDRARFKPALGPDGKPAKGAIVEHIQWEIR